MSASSSRQRRRCAAAPLALALLNRASQVLQFFLILCHIKSWAASSRRNRTEQKEKSHVYNQKKENFHA